MKAKLSKFMVNFTNLLPLGDVMFFRSYHDVQIYPRCVFVSYGPLQKLIRDFKEQNVKNIAHLQHKCPGRNQYPGVVWGRDPETLQLKN